MSDHETIPILASPIGESRNPPGSTAVVCPGCLELLSVDEYSTGLLNNHGHRYSVWCWRCAAAKWPEMEILNSEGVWFWTEEINGIKIGQICVGRLTLRGWLHGATKEGGQS